MDIILTTRNRPDLALQTIKTLRDNSELPHRIMVVDAHTFPSLNPEKLYGFHSLTFNLYFSVVDDRREFDRDSSRNFGVLSMRRGWKPIDQSTVILFTDDDFYYLPGWDKRIEEAFALSHITALAGWLSPGQVGRGGPSESLDLAGKTRIRYTQDVGENCLAVRWSTIDSFDGFSQEKTLVERIAEQGKWIGCLDPSIAIHCGLTNSENEPIEEYNTHRLIADRAIQDLHLQNVIVR